MKKMLLISCVMLALTASVSLAQGTLNISWGPECASDALVINKTFACLVNTGSNVMVASFVPTASHPLFLALDACIDGQVAAPATIVPDWWQFKNAGTCRLAALSAGAIASVNAANCIDNWAGQGTATVDYYGDPLVAAPVTGTRARIKIGVSVPAIAGNPVEGGLEYFAFTVAVNNTKTRGAGTLSCAGCLTPMAWVFNSLMPAYSDGGSPPVYSSENISTPLVNQCITWQGGATGLCGETSAQNKTWGQVKSLYR
jgi:hypothetical protein